MWIPYICRNLFLSNHPHIYFVKKVLSTIVVYCAPCPNWSLVLALNLTYTFLHLLLIFLMNLPYGDILHSMLEIACPFSITQASLKNQSKCMYTAWALGGDNLQRTFCALTFAAKSWSFWQADLNTDLYLKIYLSCHYVKIPCMEMYQVHNIYNYDRKINKSIWSKTMRMWPFLKDFRDT
jgi:hypothetical protein